MFPNWFEGPLGESIILRAREAGLLDIRIVNFRDWATDKHQSVDDAPYGGGGGMLLAAPPLAGALDATIGKPGEPERAHVVYMSPRGRTFDQRRAINYAKLSHLAIICGHYEGIDQRLLDTRVDEELSIGDFVLTGGEIPAMAVVDAVARMVPGVLGNETSADRDSFMEGLLEGPHYTRPPEFEGRQIPEVLLSGNHKAIDEWREEEALRITKHARPDLYAALLLHPAQIRRLARRGRPFAIWRTGKTPEILFATSRVRGLPDLAEQLTKTRYEKGLEADIRFAEFPRAGSGDPDADRAEFLQDLEAAVRACDENRSEFPAVSERLIRNLARAAGLP